MLDNRYCKQQMKSNTCPYLFCGCETIKSVYEESEQSVELKVYLCILWVLLIVMAGIKMGLEWFIFKDYYPLKQKSPILCIMMIMSICTQLILYPVLYTSNYFTLSFIDLNVRLKFRAIQTGLQFSAYMVYFVRSMRIAYAHDAHSSLSKTLPFRIFQKQSLLALIISIFGVLKAIPVLMDHVTGNQNHFSLTIEYQVPSGKPEETLFIIRTLLSGFVWQIVLIYCLWLQRNINQRYSMKNQLLLVISADLILSVVNSYFLLSSITQDRSYIMPFLCNDSWVYPPTELIKLINMIALLYISIDQPLRRKKIYHRLLPTGRHYGFTKTMRDFLMEEEFLRVFSKYLEHLDEVNETEANSTLLNFWKQLIILKLNKKDSELSKLGSIRELIDNVKDVLFVEEHDLIINLTESIVGLEQSITNSDIIKQRYRESINEKVDELEKVALERLDKIYVKDYSKTESYYHLKAITDDNKRVNMNMIMLNLALIVDSQNEFSS